MRPPCPSPDRMTDLLLFAEGAWGLEVANRVVQLAPSTSVLSLVKSAGSFASLIHSRAFVGVALWRRYPDEEDRLDAACAQEVIAWSGVVLEETHLRCGPVVVPGRGACYACYRKRWMSHAMFPERERAVEEAYANDASLGIRGFTPSSVRIAAAALLLDREEAERAPGRLRLIDLIHCGVEETRVVRVHGCGRCSHPWPPGDRYIRELVNSLRAGRS